MSEIIDKRAIAASPSGNPWDSLMRSPSFKEHMAGHLDDETQKWLADEYASINEDEQRDYANQYAISHKHTREEYEQFRQEKLDKAIGDNLSRLDTKALTDLEADLASINEDEQRDYANEFAISHKHTKEDYDRFRQEAIAKAFHSEKTTEQETETGDVREDELDAARQKELEAARQKELEDLEKEIEAAEKEAAKKQAEIELLELEKEEAELQRTIDENNEDIKQLEEELKELRFTRPLVAINADLSHDARELASDLAERDLNDETSKAKLLKRLWKGTLFKKYYERKYAGEYLRHERMVKTEDELDFEDGEEGNGKDKGIDVHTLAKKRSAEDLERFVLGATEDMRYIHEKIGKAKKDGTYDGEKLIPADERTSAEIKSAIEKFAQAKITDGKTLEDLKREFKNEVGRIKAGAIETGRIEDGTLIDNYLDVAIQARERFEHVGSMEKVMEGFKVYNAEVRSNIRTQAHRDNIDKIVDWYEGSKIGQFVPPEIVAGALSVASGLGQIGTRAILGAVGGIGGGTLASYLRERNHITGDRTRMLRDVANGLVYKGQATEKPKTKMAKYEARIGGTLYELKSATALTKEVIDTLGAEGEGKNEVLLRAIAEARVRIDLSDSEEKDLISYTSEDKRGKERKELDRATITAERMLSETDQEKVKLMREQIQKEILQNVEENDKKFKRMRTLMALKKAGKTLAIGLGTFFGTQEAMALIDPNKIGIFEKFGLIKTQNNTDASETLLASGFGLNRGTYDTPQTTEPVQYRADQEVEIAQAEANGYIKTEISEGWTETKSTITEVSPASSDAAVRVEYDGWGSNGTGYSDGNELRAYLTENGGISSGMYGVSTTTNGLSLDYDNLAALNQVKGYITIGGNKFEVVSTLNENGQLTWGENGIFTLSNGGTIRGISESGEKLYRYFEIAADTGVDADGIQHIIPFATDVGSDSFSGTITQVAEEIIEHPAVYEFTKTIHNITTRGVALDGGLAFAHETARTGLGTASERIIIPNETPAPNTPPTPASEAPSQPETPPAPNDESSAPNSTPPNPEPEPTTGEEPDQKTSTDPDDAGTEGGPNLEAQQFSDSMLDKIKENAEAIGGQESVDILTSDSLRIGQSTIDRLYDWWDGLTESQQTAVKDIVKEINSNENRDSIKWGRAARTFLTFNLQAL